MSSLIILRRSGHRWPVLAAYNRDALPDRSFEGPDRHWSDLPDVIGPWDQVGGGTWFAINANGVFAALLNRADLGAPSGPRRSRGELPLEALSNADASAAAESLVHIDPSAYAPFNLLIADNTFACWLKHDGISKKIQVSEIPEGYSFLTAQDRNDYNLARVKTYLPRFQSARIPDPDTGQWRDWQVLLGQRLHSPKDGPTGAMCLVQAEGECQTVCSQLLAIPAVDNPEPAQFLFCPGRPGEAEFATVKI